MPLEGVDTHDTLDFAEFISGSWEAGRREARRGEPRRSRRRLAFALGRAVLRPEVPGAFPEVERHGVRQFYRIGLAPVAAQGGAAVRWFAQVPGQPPRVPDQLHVVHLGACAVGLRVGQEGQDDMYVNAGIGAVFHAGEEGRPAEQGTYPALRPLAGLAVVQGSGIVAAPVDRDHDQEVMIVFQVGKLPPHLESAVGAVAAVHAVVVHLIGDAAVVIVQVAQDVRITLLPEQLRGQAEGDLDSGRGRVFGVALPRAGRRNILGCHRELFLGCGRGDARSFLASCSGRRPVLANKAEHPPIYPAGVGSRLHPTSLEGRAGDEDRTGSGSVAPDAGVRCWGPHSVERFTEI